MSSDKSCRINQVINLWHEAFGDSEEEISAFLDIFGGCIHIKSVDGKIVSQLFLIPGELNSHKAFYLYAAATLKEYRGRGYMAELLSDAKEYALRNNADYILLMPGESSLYGYYEKFGYRSLCFEKECIFDSGNIPDFETSRENFYTHNKRVYEYALTAYGNTEIFRNEYGTLIYTEKNGFADIKEWNSGNISGLLKSFYEIIGFDRLKISLPADTEVRGSCEIKNHGMILTLRDAPCYGKYYLDYVLD